MLKVCYVPANSTTFLAFFLYFLAVAINSSNAANKAGGACHLAVYITYMSMGFVAFCLTKSGPVSHQCINLALKHLFEWHLLETALVLKA